MSNCTQCNHEIENELFCPNCGKKQGMVSNDLQSGISQNSPVIESPTGIQSGFNHGFGIGLGFGVGVAIPAIIYYVVIFFIMGVNHSW